MNEVSDFTEQFDRCLMNEPAFCSAACPFGLDVRAFTEKVRQHRLSAAYKQYRDAVVFPGIVSRICDRPCENVCPLGPIDRPIDLRGLELSVIESAKPAAPDSYNLPPRNKSIAVIGAGLSGLACALKLSQKKYAVTVFSNNYDEASPGDSLRFVGGEKDKSTGYTRLLASHDRSAKILPDEFLAEIEYQFSFETFELITRRVKDREEIMAMGFDAVYVATGEGGEDFGLSVTDENALPSALIPHHSEEKNEHARGGLHDLAAEAGVCWIAGGALTGRKDVYAIADGAIAAASIDAFLRSGIVKTDRPARSTKMVLAPLHLDRYKDGHSDNEVAHGDGPFVTNSSHGDGPFVTNSSHGDGPFASEAERCLGCRCDACMLYCDLPPYADKWPPRISDEVFVTTLPGKAEVKATPAKRLMNIDNLSGVLVNVCPEGIDMDALLLAGRQSMHRQDKMPWAFHEFWLRDMEHANGESAAIVIGHGGDIAFFPGCQLGAASPGLVISAYEELLSLDKEKKISLSGLITRCCGAPAEWAGDEELFAEALADLRADWESLGRPTLACACPTCMKMLGKHLPEIETISLYEVLPLTRDDNAASRPETWSVFDPCSVMHLKDETKTKKLRGSVRNHAEAMGLDVAPLPVQENVPRCCGFGGQPESADPVFVNKVREDRASESGLPYLCYCMNCREAFMKTGKPSAHILEMRYASAAGTQKEPSPLCSYPGRPELSPSGRRANREALKEALSGQARKPKDFDFELLFAAGVRESMDTDKIIVEDVYAVIDHMLHTKESVINTATGVRSGSLVIGRTTYWVDYTEEDGSLTLTSAYAHRLAVEHEAVWGGTTKEQRRQNPGTKPSEVRADGVLICEHCDAGMKEMEAEFSYLNRSFRHKVMRCPVCGLAYIPEELARGRMREVEMALEDK